MINHHADEVLLPVTLQQYQLELPNQARKKRALECILQHREHTDQIAIFVRATDSVLQLSELVCAHDVSCLVLWICTVSVLNLPQMNIKFL